MSFFDWFNLFDFDFKQYNLDPILLYELKTPMTPFHSIHFPYLPPLSKLRLV